MKTFVAILTIAASARSCLGFAGARARPVIFWPPSRLDNKRHHRHECSSRRCGAQELRRKRTSQIHLYRKFHDYAWDKVMGKSDADLDTVPEELRSNASPVKGAPTGTNVVANVRSTSQFPFLAEGRDGTGDGQVLRLARSAFLETQTPTSESLITPMTIHVLNFVSFPSPLVRDSASGEYVGLPIFGADIVSLPGNKHLVALDFQPVLEVNESTPLFPKQYSHLESKLETIHSKYQQRSADSPALLPWGGDIPEKAKRFFSPHALWTRLGDDSAMDTVSTLVWEAFREYTDLYFELMDAAQSDVDRGRLEIVASDQGIDGSNPVWDGQLDYLEYRRTNDPARPMLQRLYGNEWSERVIGDVLFPDL